MYLCQFDQIVIYFKLKQNIISTKNTKNEKYTLIKYI